jgi:hypothetical protein
MSVEKNPGNPMLGRREIVDGKAGKYVWLTYKQVYDVYDVVVKVGTRRQLPRMDYEHGGLQCSWTLLCSSL